MIDDAIQKPALQKCNQVIFHNLILDILKKYYVYSPEIQALYHFRERQNMTHHRCTLIHRELFYLNIISMSGAWRHLGGKVFQR